MSLIYVDNPIIPRFHPDDPAIREETKRHHLNRYNLAVGQLRRMGELAVDLCCGTGYGTEILARAGATAVGVDLSEEAIAYARATNPTATYEQGYVQDFLRGGKRNPKLVTFFEAIEHIPRPDGHDVLDAVQESLARNGKFLVSTPRDIRSDVNPDHITQWEYDELGEALHSRFGHVALLGQDWATGEFTTENQANASFYVAIASKPRE